MFQFLLTSCSHLLYVIPFFFLEKNRLIFTSLILLYLYWVCLSKTLKGLINHSEGIILKIHCQPKSSKTEISGFFNECIKLKVQQPPVDNAANEACIKYLSKFLNIGKSGIMLIRGDKSREKEFLIKNMSERDIVRLFEEKGLKWEN